MFEKVNPSHTDKLCDRIAGAIVDMAYVVNYMKQYNILTVEDLEIRLSNIRGKEQMY